MFKTQCQISFTFLIGAFRSASGYKLVWLLVSDVCIFIHWGTLCQTKKSLIFFEDISTLSRNFGFCTKQYSNTTLFSLGGGRLLFLSSPLLYTRFFIRTTFIRNTRLKFGSNNFLLSRKLFEIRKRKVHQRKALAWKRILNMFSRRVGGGKLVKSSFKNNKKAG